MDFILRKQNIFKNQNKVPLNVLDLEYKTIIKIKKTSKDLLDDTALLKKNYEIRYEKYPALHQIWIQNCTRQFPLYQAYYTDLEWTEDDSLSYTNANEKYLDSLKFLLGCNYHQFWCYITQHPQVPKALRSLIFQYTPSYEFTNVQENCLKIYSEILDKFAQVFARLLMFRSSDTEFMEESVAFGFLEEKQIINFPIIVNLCATYQNLNSNLTNDACIWYFSHKKHRGETETKKMFEHISLVLEMLGGLICNFAEKPQQIVVGIRPKPAFFDPNWYLEIVAYLLDTLSTLNAFLLHTNDWSIDLLCKEGIPFRLTYFYNQVCPKIYGILDGKRNGVHNWEVIKGKIEDKLAQARFQCVNCFHQSVSFYINNIIKNHRLQAKQEENLENYIKLISAAAEDELFMFDYHNVNPIDMQLQLITDYYPELDTMRTDYILDCLSTLPQLNNLELNEAKKSALNIKNNKKTEQPVEVEEHIEEVTVTDEEINEKVLIVLDALPYLGDDFICKCLNYYNYDPIAVISAILDENLPPNLASLPRDTIRVPSEPEPPKPVLAYRGKKPSFNDAAQLLNDKTDLKEVKDFILKTTTTSYDYMYDDEYDDRDDYVPPSESYIKEKDAEEDPYAYMENRFEGYEVVSDPSSSENEVEEEKPKVAQNKFASKTGKGGFVPFCEDPEKVRERRRLTFRGGKSSRGGGGAVPKANLVGKPKGQGQDASVLKQRDKKTVNKSSRANHNRKGGADFKRSRGMF